MAKNEMTRVQALTYILAIASMESLDREDDAELTTAIEVVTHMRDQLAKPKAKTDTKSKTRLENEATARALYNVAPDGIFGSDFVMTHTTAMTPQKVVGIMKVGIELGLFERLKDGKQTVYHKVD